MLWRTTREHRTPQAVADARPRSALRMDEGWAMPIAGGTRYGTVLASQCQCYNLFPPKLPRLLQGWGRLGGVWTRLALLRNSPGPWLERLDLYGWTALW